MSWTCCLPEYWLMQELWRQNSLLHWLCNDIFRSSPESLLAGERPNPHNQGHTRFFPVSQYTKYNLACTPDLIQKNTRDETKSWINDVCPRLRTPWDLCVAFLGRCLAISARAATRGTDGKRHHFNLFCWLPMGNEQKYFSDTAYGLCRNPCFLWHSMNICYTLYGNPNS